MTNSWGFWEPEYKRSEGPRVENCPFKENAEVDCRCFLLPNKTFASSTHSWHEPSDLTPKSNVPGEIRLAKNIWTFKFFMLVHVQ